MLETFEKILATTAAHYGIALRNREVPLQPQQRQLARQDLVAA
jgi:hypothetical protein